MTHLERAARVAWNLPRLLWFVAALLLVGLGFLFDGSSEVGHHAALIIGGAFCGAGVAKS